DARDHRTGNHARPGDAEDQFGVVGVEDLEGEDPAQLTEKRPVHLQHRVGGRTSGTRTAGYWRARRDVRHLGSYIANASSRKLFPHHEFLAPPLRRLVTRRDCAAATRLPERGARARTSR